MPVSHSHQFLCVSFSPPAIRRDQHRIVGVGDIPDFMRLAAEGAQHVDRIGIAFRQRLAVADAHHLRAAGFIFSFLAGNVGRYFGCAGSVTSTIEVPFGSAFPVSGLTGAGISSVPP